MFSNLFFRWFFVIQSLWISLLITPGLYITFPASGSNVNGIVEIRGSIPEVNFSSAEVSYAYGDANQPNWFPIARIDHAVQDGILGSWDTTTITDGTYQLRLAVTLTNGTVNEIVISDINVMNYTHPGSTEVNTTETTIPGTPTGGSTGAPVPHPTNIPDNPASTTSGQITASVWAGIVAAILFLGLLLIYSVLRNSH